MGRRSGSARRDGLAEIPLKRFMDQRLIDAISHPARAHVLATLNERVASPSEVAAEVGLDVKYLNYHFEALEKSGCIELVKVEPKRGARQHFYRATKTIFIDDSESERLPASLRIGMTAGFLQKIVDDANRAVEAGTFDSRTDRHVSWTSLLVDERGWRDLNAALKEALDRVLSVQLESAERLEAGDEEPIPVTVGMASFEMPPEGAAARRDPAIA
jgi:predicted ArsR family transcriptional regulator